MDIKISGKQIDVGDALRTHVENNLVAAVGKYFDRPVDACRVFATGDPTNLDPVAVSPKIREILGACP